MLLVRYSLDTHARYSTYQVSERLHQGPEYLHNYLRLHHNYLTRVTLGVAVLAQRVTRPSGTEVSLHNQ